MLYKELTKIGESHPRVTIKHRNGTEIWSLVIKQTKVRRAVTQKDGNGKTNRHKQTCHFLSLISTTNLGLN
jgi:hypothetical protein